MKRILSVVKSLLVAVALVGGGGAAHATLVNSSDPLNFSWSYNSGTGAGVLTGYGSMTFSGFNSSYLTVATTLYNTSDFTERLTSFGFGIDPNATGVAFSDLSDGGMVAATLNNIPSLATIEVCSYGGQNCSGGSNGGIRGGRMDQFSMILTGTWGSSIDIAPIGFKYQTGFGSFEFTTSSSSSSSGSVPEPNSAPLVLLGLALLAGSFVLRRRSGHN